MGIAVGRLKAKSVKWGILNIKSVYVGEELVWPEAIPDLDPAELIAVLSCITMGYWQDVLPWNDETPWMDKYTIN